MGVLLAGLVVASALAATQHEVEADAEALAVDVQVLAADVAACHEGECLGAEALVAEFEALDTERLAVHGDRQALGACNCSRLDEALARIDVTTAAVGNQIQGWETNQ
jgi:hypothetical protein